jgi:hypothetical protein
MIDKPATDISVCVFGSSARATNDAISDRDVLIVAGDIQAAMDTVAQWTELGWSVSLYSRTRLNSVARAGSLFVKHLQLEGTMMSDPSGWLTETLEQYRVKQSYSSEIEDALDLALPLQRLKSNGPIADPALAADIGYVFLRNYAIYRCAEQQTYVFDYAALLEELQGIERFSDRCRSQLMRLRMGKHIYRSGHSGLRDLSDMRLAADWIEEACSNLTLDCIAPETPVRSLATPYSTLRDCEAALSVRGLFDSPHAPLPQPIKKIWRMIKSPKDYSWHVTKIDGTWVARVNAAIADFSLDRSSIEAHPLSMHRSSSQIESSRSIKRQK